MEAPTIMLRPRPLFLALAALLCLAGLAGCAPSTAGYEYAGDPRATNVLARDKAISTEILARFADEASVGVNALSVSTYDGQVFLVGEYTGPAQLQTAKRIASHVKGVRGVTIYAQPASRRGECDSVANLTLAQEVGASLIADKTVQGYNVDVKAVQCRTVVLLGLVSDKAEIARAETLAAEVKGVAKVVSYLKVYTPNF